MEPYYYTQLNKTKQAAYHAIETGLHAMLPSFSIPRLEQRELAELFFQIRLDHPEIFYAFSYRCRYAPNSDSMEFIPEYLFKKAKIKEHQKAMESRIAKLVRAAAGRKEWEKEQYIHDFICAHVQYDKLKKPYSHEIIGPLGNGIGVCEGIAKTVKILCDSLGIWCIVVISDASPAKQIRYRHAWNLIRIEGNYYHIDATFDCSLGTKEWIRYDYMNLSDEQLFRDHEPALYPIPACTDRTQTYYIKQKLAFTKMEEVEKRALQAAKKGKCFLFQWRGSYLTKEVLKELLIRLEQAAVQKGKHPRVSLNWSQAVLLVDFTEQVPEEEVVMEQAANSILFGPVC